MKEIRSALVLSGGGALGIAHIGAAERLYEQGFRFDFFSGVSAGALVAALLAFGSEPHQLLQVVKERKVVRALLEFSPRFPGTLISGRKVESLLRDVFGNKKIEDAAFPLSIGVTDFESGEKITLDKGRLIDALRASISVPILFEPYFHPEIGKWLVDGGLTQNLPVDIAMERYGGDKIIAIDVASSIKPFQGPPARSYFFRPGALAETFIRSFRIVLKNQQRNWPRDPRVSIIYPRLEDFSAINVFRSRALYEAGRVAAEEYCAEWQSR